MSKASIKKTASNYVTLSYDDDMGERITAEYFVPHNGGYVRDDHGNQICAGLSTRGWTLEATPETLIAIIRREWRKNRRLMA